jgi:hypothetical protein
MAMLVTLMLMPGGVVFLFVWVLGRTCVTRLREARLAGNGHVDILKTLAGIRLGDIWREARALSGWPHATPHL